jgi:hypothetical protein
VVVVVVWLVEDVEVPIISNDGEADERSRLDETNSMVNSRTSCALVLS